MAKNKKERILIVDDEPISFRSWVSRLKKPRAERKPSRRSKKTSRI